MSGQETILTKRRRIDRVAKHLFLSFAIFPIVLVILIVISLWVRTQPILRSHTLIELLTGQIWRPLQGQFGYFPFIMGTLWVTVVAMLLAVPPCLLTAIYLSEYAHKTMKSIAKPLLDLLSGIPSVVYGVWGMVAVVPWVQNQVGPLVYKWLGGLPLFHLENPTGFNIVSGGIVLGVMVAPLIIAVSYEVMYSVPEALRQASLALGATRWQTIARCVIPKAAPGIIAAIVLGFSRAFGETMAVLMVVGNVPKVPTSVFDPAYPLTALIANNYGEMMSIPLYDAALLGAALVLLVIVLLFNLVSALVLNRIIGKPTR